jgi:hypothetical protein
MSVAAIKEEATRLTREERSELVGYFISLNRTPEENEALRRELAQKIDDNDPSHWMPLEEVIERYAE